MNTEHCEVIFVKNVLITAGTKNTGYCMAQTFAAKGYNVHITSRNEQTAIEAAVKLNREFPDIRAYGYGMDQTSVESIRALFAKVKENTPSLDTFVANAADLGVGLDVYNTTEEAFDSVMDTNVKGTFFCCQEAGKLMKNGGSMVLMSSVQSTGVVEGRTVYGVSKAAISMLGKYLAYDFAPYGIRVNSVIAGAISTDRWEGVDEATLAARRANYPAGRESTMQEIADAVYFLGCEDTKTITGTDLEIDSGVRVSILPYKDRKQFKREDY